MPTPTPADMPTHVTPSSSTNAPGDQEQQKDSPSAERSHATVATNDISQMSPEDMAKELAKVRKEAAGYRTKLNEVKPLAEKYQQAEDAKKSELDKAMERIKALEAEKAQSALEACRARVSASTGVPVELLPSGTEEEITAAAEALKKWAEEKMGATSAAPYVPSVGKASGGDDRNSQARKILGL